MTQRHTSRTAQFTCQTVRESGGRAGAVLPCGDARGMLRQVAQLVGLAHGDDHHGFLSLPSASINMSWPLFRRALLVLSTMQLASRALRTMAAISSESGSSEQTAKLPPRRLAMTMAKDGVPVMALDARLARIPAQPVKTGDRPARAEGRSAVRNSPQAAPWRIHGV